VIDGVVADAEVPGDVPADAPADVPIDAGHRRPIRLPLDAGRSAFRDAAIAAAAIDASQPQGMGALTAKHKSDRYLNVVVDGRIIGPTPKFSEPIAAGSHVIELIDPKTSEVIVRSTVRVEVGKTVTIVEP
jgi:hypothetical protein